MTHKVFGHTNKVSKASQNPIETLKNQHSAAHSPGFFDNLIGNYDYDDDYLETPQQYQKKEEPKAQTRKEFTVFSAAEHQENEKVTHEIEQLTAQIRQEIIMLKKSSADLAQEVQQVEKISLQSLPENAGIYHVRFLEVMIALLQTVREKIGDSSTWLTAMVSKKKKRGSLFAVNAKKKGTQYSLSQELQSARSIQ